MQVLENLPKKFSPEWSPTFVALAIFVPQVYYDFSDAILPPDVLSNAPKKIFMDQTVYLATKTSIYLTLVMLISMCLASPLPHKSVALHAFLHSRSSSSALCCD